MWHMIGPLLWLIYLLTYSFTEHALFGSKRRFGVYPDFYTIRRIV